MTNTAEGKFAIAHPIINFVKSTGGTGQGSWHCLADVTSQGWIMSATQAKIYFIYKVWNDVL